MQCINKEIRNLKWVEEILITQTNQIDSPDQRSLLIMDIISRELTIPDLKIRFSKSTKNIKSTKI